MVLAPQDRSLRPAHQEPSGQHQWGSGGRLGPSGRLGKELQISRLFARTQGFWRYVPGGETGPGRGASGQARALGLRPEELQKERGGGGRDTSLCGGRWGALPGEGEPSSAQRPWRGLARIFLLAQTACCYPVKNGLGGGYQRYR